MLPQIGLLVALAWQHTALQYRTFRSTAAYSITRQHRSARVATYSTSVPDLSQRAAAYKRPAPGVP
eukprot:3810525-Rhodomonas_salina.1